MALILVQAIGCTETGTRVILRELLVAAPPADRFIVVCTSGTSRDLVGSVAGKFAERMYVLGLSHFVFGVCFRLILELVIAALGFLGIVNYVVNLSHYGLCVDRRYALYVHSPFLMDKKTPDGWRAGRSNLFKRWMLNSCLKRAAVICVQTQLMREELEKYSRSVGIIPKKVELLFPSIPAPVDKEKTASKYAFQMFYPASRFAHKRATLAIISAQRAHATNSDCGLIITVPADGNEGSGVDAVGSLSRAEVFELFKSSHALLFTSERETLGLPLLEALAYGLPVIAPDLPYARLLLGDSGTYFKCDSPASVAEAIFACKDNYYVLCRKAEERNAYLFEQSSSWRDHWKVLLT